MSNRTPSPSTSNPAKAKSMMLQAMAKNDVLGVPFAAIMDIADPEKWSDGTELFEVSFATHEKWMQEDADYAKAIGYLQEAGFRAQRQAHWLSGMSMMPEDPQIWKAMLAVFDKNDKKTPTEQAAPVDYSKLSTHELQELLKEKQMRVMKAV